MGLSRTIAVGDVLVIGESLVEFVRVGRQVRVRIEAPPHVGVRHVAHVRDRRANERPRPSVPALANG